MVRDFVKVDTRGLDRYKAAIAKSLSGGGGGPIRDCFKQWAARWRSFQQQRFIKFSRGGGNWKKLAASTQRQRRSGRGSGKNTILWDKLGSIMKALTPQGKGEAGKFEQNIPNGIRVGFGGPGRHPDGAATIADIASFHDEGKGHLPARRILGDPDSQLLSDMRSDLERACIKLTKETKI